MFCNGLQTLKIRRTLLSSVVKTTRRTDNGPRIRKTVLLSEEDTAEHKNNLE